ncbi:hypothetical protein BsWGS_29005 [Bradybaena similaris]
MPKKKANGYFIFMQEERNRIKAETKQTPSMQEMAIICNETWKRLTPEERSVYNARAKTSNVKSAQQDPDMFRMDNQRQIIAYRKSAAHEAASIRTREKQQLVKSWEGQDILDIEFHIINFQVMYTEEPVDYYLPLELGIVRFTLRDGITKQLHSFIDAGEVPHGNMHLALKHSENTHQIPLNFEEAESNHLRLWSKIEKFVVTDPRRDDVPPIFCLASEKTLVESSLDYIHYHARSGEPNIFTKIYALEDLVMSLLLQSGKFTVKPSETQIHDSLLRNQWDYISSIRCAYHDTADCSYCSLAIVKRLSFAVFDMLSSVLDFKLKETHMPDESSNPTFTVKLPSSAASGPETRGARNAWQRTTRSRSSSPPTFVPPGHRQNSAGQTAVNSWNSSRESRVQVTLSDSDDDDDDDDDDEDDASIVKSTSDQYVLKELRKPNNFPMLPFAMGSAYGRGLAVLNNKAVIPGETQNPLRYPASIRPPPGFGPRPGFPSDSMLRPQSFVRPGLASSQVRALAVQRYSLPTQEPMLEAGRARSRGRGLPPQVSPTDD